MDTAPFYQVAKHLQFVLAPVTVMVVPMAFGMGLAPLGVEVIAKDFLEFFLLLEGVLLHLFKLGFVLFS